MNATRFDLPVPRETRSFVPARSSDRLASTPPRRAWGALLGLSLVTLCQTSVGQTTILATQPGGGALPAGWVGQNNVATNAIDKTSYWLVEPGASKDYIISSGYDLSAYTSATINVNVATFGSGTALPLLIEYSTDSGANWVDPGSTTATPSSSTYIAGGPVTITGSFTASTKFRFSANGSSGRGVRIQQLGITAVTDITPPAVATLSPANNAVAVAVDADLVVAFDEAVAAGTGAVKLYAAGGSLVESFPVTAGNISGSTATFNPTADLALSTTYYVQIDSGAFVDLATPANAFGGISGTSTWTFTTVAPDTTGPAVTAVAPAHGATGVAVNEVLSVSFDELIFAGSGNILIKKASDNSTVATLAVTDENQVLIADSDAYLAPPNDLPVDTTLYVEIPAGAFKDAIGNATTFYGGGSVWSFTTVPPDTTGPIVTAVTPAHGATGVPVGQVLTVTFDEPVFAGSGDILIKDSSNNSVVATLTVTDGGQVVILNNEASLIPPAGLPANATVYVEIPAGAFKDTSDNATAAYGGSGVWSFGMVTIPELTTAGPYTQNFTGFSSTNPALPSGWSLTGPVTTFQADLLHVTWGEGFNSGLRGGADLLGYQHTSSTGVLTKTLTLINATGAQITDLTVSYTGRAARLAETRKPAYIVAVAGTPVPSLDYSTLAGDNVIRSASVSGLSIAAGAAFTITWTSDRDEISSGSSRQIGLTGVSVSVGAAILPPSVAAVTLDLLTLTATGVSASSNVTADGGATLSARGFVYAATAINPSPELGGTGVTNLPDASATVGGMTTTLTGLTPATGYSLRAYATNSEGTTYSNAVTFTTPAQPPSLVTSYTQPFDGFTGTLPNGWSLVSSGGVTTYSGSWTSTSTNGGVYGGVSNPGVLGYMHTSGTGTATVTLTLQNDTGSTLTDLWVSYLGRVERLANTRLPEWTVSLNGSAVPELAYSTGAGVDQTKTHQITGLSIAPGANVTLTWVSDRGLPSGSSRRIGIADVYVGLSEPTSGFAGWATTNSPGQTPDQDYDGDGLDNGVEYFMGTPGNVFTQVPGIVGNKITWPMNATATGVSYKVFTSADLAQWNEATTGISTVGGNLVYDVPGTTTQLFIRLEVTVQ